MNRYTPNTTAFYCETQGGIAFVCKTSDWYTVRCSGVEYRYVTW